MLDIRLVVLLWHVCYAVCLVVLCCVRGHGVEHIRSVVVTVCDCELVLVVLGCDRWRGYW